MSILATPTQAAMRLTPDTECESRGLRRRQAIGGVDRATVEVGASEAASAAGIRRWPIRGSGRHARAGAGWWRPSST